MPDPRTAARTHLADTRPEQDDVTVPTPQRRPLGLSLTQIAGGALAAVTAAVAASFLGVAGTITGAAFGSVVSSIGAAVYSTSLSRAARASRVLVVRRAASPPTTRRACRHRSDTTPRCSPTLPRTP